MEKIIVCADLGHFRAYRVTLFPGSRKSPRMELISTMDPDLPHERAAEKFSDSAGRFKRDGIQKGGAGYGERHTIAQEEEKRLIRKTAERINDLMKIEGYPTWSLAASKSIVNRLVNALEPAVLARMESNIKADLTGLHQSEILTRFETAIALT